MPTTVTETRVPNLQIHVMESQEQFEDLVDIDPDALYFTPFEVLNYAEDEKVVHIEERETIEGVKTFVDGLRAPTPNQNPGSLETNVATTQYVDTYGGQLDDVEFIFNGASSNNANSPTSVSVVDRTAVITLDVDYVTEEEPNFTGSHAPTFTMTGAGNDPVRLATMDDVGVTDIQINSEVGSVDIIGGLADLDLTSYVELVSEQSPQPASTPQTINANTLQGHPASDFVLSNSVDFNNFVLKTDPEVTNKRSPLAHSHSLADLYYDTTAANPQLLSNYLTTNFAGANHTHNTLQSANNISVSVPNAIANDQVVLKSILDNKITYGTEDKTPGVSNLPEGTIYIRYSAV